MQSYYAGQRVSIKPTYIVCAPWYETVGAYNRKQHRNSLSNLLNNDTKGKLSNKAASKVKTAVNWLVAAAKTKRVYSKELKKVFTFKINFITLTMPETCKDVEASYFKKELLNTWLTMAKYRFNLKNYIWRIERQKNGTLHVHLTTDTFMHHREIRDTWNRILDKKGLLNSWREANEGKEPNSTDVHSVKNIKDVGAYLSKYMTKNEDGKKVIQGRQWGCNYELSDKNKLTIYLTDDECRVTLKPLMRSCIQYKSITTKPDCLGETKHLADMYLLKKSDWEVNISGELKRIYNNRLFAIRHHVQEVPDEVYST